MPAELAPPDVALDHVVEQHDLALLVGNALLAGSALLAGRAVFVGGTPSHDAVVYERTFDPGNCHTPLGT